MWQVKRQVLLTQLLPTGLDRGKERKIERENREEREMRYSRERSSTFSLDFPAIGPVNSGEARSKVGLRCKGYRWVLVLGSFDKLRKVGVFSYLVISCLKIHEMVLGVVRLEMATDFGSKEVEPMIDEGVVHGQPTD